MNKTIYCGFQKVYEESVFFRKSSLEKGRALYEAHHVDAVREESHGGSSEITAKCLSQVLVNKLYDIRVVVRSCEKL